MKWQKIAIYILILGSIFWNAWILGWLNHGSAGYLRMSISELNVIHQPNYLLFTWAEYISAIFLIAAAICLFLANHKKTLFVSICIALAAIGLFTIYDAANPLDCNQYQNNTCSVKDNSNNVSLVDKHHNTESRITAYTSILLSLLIVIWLFSIKSNTKMLFLSCVSLILVIGTLAVLNYSSHIFANAILQRIWNVAITADFILAGYSATFSMAKTNME